jgi:probable F420-dependent oxidoreductase
MPGPWAADRAGADLFWQVVELCERSDIDSLWFPERLSAPVPVLDPLVAMAAVAARTRRLKFGPSVLVTPFRTPVLLARELATLDHLSGGRLLPAFGVGVEQAREFQAAGVPFHERGRRTDEALAILRRCWSEDEVTFAGTFWQLERITVLPRPVQRPLPMWIGGASEAAVRRAGRLGDGWVPSFITPEQLEAGIARAQAYAAQAGREIPRDHFGVLVNFWLAADPVAARALAAPYVPRGRVDDATLERVTAFGPVALLLDRLDAYVRAGASKFILRPLGPPDGMLAQLQQVAEDVVPLFHAR